MAMSYEPIKRGMDIFFAVVLGTLFLPFCLIAAIAIKLESSNGPIFADTPKRLGKNGRSFYPYKFRSMIPNAIGYLKSHPELYEKYKKGSFKLHDDPRVTKVGRFIRKYSIDEVPQFINIFRNEMSLIGPRPYYADELETQASKYPHTKDLIKKALSVKPGITGQWQVNGRSDVNFDKRIEMDAEYARKMTSVWYKALWYDLKILFKTPIAMLSGRGAV